MKAGILAACLLGVQLALQRFLSRGRGHIVNVASSAGLVGVAGGATYSATKHGVVGFTRALRAETRGTGVSTTVVMPGVVRTEMVEGFLSVRGTRIIEPSAVGNAIVKALQTGRAEILVPPELAPAARLAAGLSARGSDLLKRLLRADEVMGNADRSARDRYERRARP